MAVGKNKRLSKGKKGTKKKVIEPLSRKDWYSLKAPAIFKENLIGKTIVNRTQGNRLASDGLKGRVVSACVADLQKNESQAHQWLRFRVEDVQGTDCLTNFWGMRFTTDKLKSLVRKWQSLIEAFVEVKTTDGFNLRVFIIGFTAKQENARKKTCYGKSSQIKQIRAKMMQLLTREIAAGTMKDLVRKLIANSFGTHIEKVCKRIYPIKDVYIYKVKVLKAPKSDPNRLLELHSIKTVDQEVGEVVERSETE